MKVHYFKLMLVVIGLAGLTLTSCKKQESAADETISAQDANSVSNSLAITSDDAAAAAGQVSTFKSLSGWNNAGNNLFVGGTITDTSSTGITIVYSSNNSYNGITRSGTITITGNGTPWATAGSVITINYTNVTVTDQTTGNSYVLNGTHTVTNETGGLAWEVMAGLAPGTTVSHRIQSSNMTITFPNGTTRTWTVDRTRTWTSAGSGSSQVITVSVTSQANGGVAESGINRFGDSFSNTFVSTVSANNSSCETWKPYTGSWTHTVGSNTLNVEFGTNSTGTQVGSPTYCGTLGDYGYYITLTRGTGTRTRFVSYW